MFVIIKTYNKHYPIVLKYFYLFATFIFTFIFNLVSAQAPAIEWQKCYGGTKAESTSSVCPTLDGGYVMVGATVSANGDVTQNAGNSDSWVVKVNSTGILQWQKSYGGSLYENFQKIKQTPDGGYIVVGYSNSVDGDLTSNKGWNDVWIVKLSGAGNIEWQKSYGGAGRDEGNSIDLTSDGGFIIGATSESPDGDVSNHHKGDFFNSNDDFWVLKLSSNGSLEWEKSLGGGSEDRAKDIRSTPDGGFIICGYTLSNNGDVIGFHSSVNGNGPYDAWIVKLDFKGKIEWQKSMGGTDHDYAYAVELTANGGYVIAGNSVSGDGDLTVTNGSSDVWIITLNSSGNIIWQKKFGGKNAEVALDIAVASDGNYIMSGYSTSFDGDVGSNNGSFDVWVFKISPSGVLEWQKNLGGSAVEFGYCIEETKDKGFIVAGFSSSNDGDVSGNHGENDFWIVKLSKEVCTPTINISSPTNSICSGQSITFNATPTSEGSIPMYQWKVNDLNAGTNNSTYTSSTLKNNDKITCELTSNASCATTQKVTSNTIIVSVDPSPVINITGDTCVGSTLTVNSSVAPSSLIWTLNGTSQVANQIAGFQADAVTIAGGNGSGNNPNQLNKPTRFFVDAVGNMYIPDMDNNRIQKWAPGATSGVTVAGGNGSGSAPNQLNRPTSISIDSKGVLYITDQNNNRVQKWVPGTSSGTSFGPYFSLPTDIYIDPLDNIYVSEQNNLLVIKYPAGSLTGIVVAGGNGWGNAANQLSSPTGMFVDAVGNIYVCDTDNDRVQKWAPGALAGITVAGGNGHGSGANQLANPLGVFVDSYGNVLVADYNNARVQIWALGATSGTTIAGGIGVGNGSNQLNHPETVWLNPNGDLIVSDLTNHRIQKFSNSLTKSYTTLIPGNYTATVTTSNGCIDTSNVIVVVASKTPQVSITSNSTTVCPALAVTFTASPVYGGAAPLYQWKINGANAGPTNNNAVFSSSSLNSGDVVSCIITSNAEYCLTSKKATSNGITMGSASPGVASVTIAATDTVICAGSLVRFTATPTNGGTIPGYKWLVNGVDAAANTSTYTTSFLKDADVVSCIITSSANLCPGNLISTSNGIVIQVVPQKTASVIIAASDTLICINSLVQFNAAYQNGGTNPIFQWKVNGVNVGNNNAIFSTNSLKNNDVVSCSMMSDVKCISNSPATSNLIKLGVDQIPVITMRPDTVIFSGNSIRLNTVVTGNSPTYLWSPSATLNDAMVISPIAKPTATTTFKLVTTTAAGCTAFKQVTITTIESIDIPTAFSPNNDGINDVWSIVGLSSYTDCKVEIYNRYGQLLFQSNGYIRAWDGSYKNSPLPVAAYYYIIKSKILGTKSGSVTILK